MALTRRVYVLLIVGFLIFFGYSPAEAARLVRVRIYLGEKVILEGSFGVRGTEDADECWRLFQHNTEKKERWTAFRETEHFDQTRLIADESIPDRFVLKANEGEWISIDIGYGGIAGVKELVLYRYTDTFATKKDTRKWILDAKQLDDCFDHRWISDIDTALLKTPRKTK